MGQRTHQGDTSVSVPRSSFCSDFHSRTKSPIRETPVGTTGLSLGTQGREEAVAAAVAAGARG